MGSVAQKPVLETDDSEPSIEERLALIERVAASEQFSRSARLRDFLLYVGRRSLKEGSPEIHEQEIGAKVFGRPESYDRTSDNIVRVNATELRKRIDSYFAQDGARETLIFEIPRGGYKPVFRWRLPELPDPKTSAAAEPAHDAAQGLPTAIATRRRSYAVIVLTLICLSLAAACVILFQQNRVMRAALHPWEGQPAVAAFWNGFLDSHRQTDVVLPDDSASVIEDITGNPITLGEYLSRNYVRQVQTSNLSEDRKADVYQVYNHNLVTFGAVRAAQTVLSEIPANDPHYLTLARNFTADEVKRDNVVLIGGQKSVPWDHLFDDQLNFVTDYDYAHGAQIVRNRNPRPGEQPIYTVSLSPDNFYGYAAIAYLPNPSRTGNVIILAGTDSDATGAAGAFLTSEEQMQKLRTALHADRFPYFEVLLKTSRLSGTFFDADLVAFRAYPNLH
ncbi:MAG: hypothetical protein ACLPZY_21775 [Terracidiphilus sp.]